MHNDEAVNTIKFRDLYEQGHYKYDPSEYHGPTLAYFTLAWTKLTRAPAFNDFDEARFRFVTVLFGAGLILLLPLVADGLGRKAAIFAAMLTAVSPAMVFYSRYYIHEMLLVFFTFLALAGGWRYSRSRKIGWALMTGAALGLLHATKETFVLELAAAAVALGVNVLWKRHPREGRVLADVEGVEGNKMAESVAGVAVEEKHGIPPSGGKALVMSGTLEPSCATPPKGGTPYKKEAGADSHRALKHASVALAAWVGVAVIFFTSFFTNASGILDSVRTYMPWLHRTAGASPHIHEWDFYFKRLAFFHVARGPVWSEGLIIGLALLGVVVAFTRATPAREDSGSQSFLRFLASYTLALTVIYSVIAYKTPWCALGFLHGMILLAGVGAVELMNRARPRWLKIAAGVLLLAGIGQLALRAWQASTVYCADRGNPYVYAQTTPDLLNLVDEVDAVAQAHPQGRHLVVKVMATDNNYWPLPWYLRRFDHVGWWSEIPPDPYAPIMIVSAKFNAALDEKKTHVMVGYFKLRQDVFLQLYVQVDLWRAYLESRPKQAERE